MSLWREDGPAAPIFCTPTGWCYYGFIGKKD